MVERTIQTFGTKCPSDPSQDMFAENRMDPTYMLTGCGDRLIEQHVTNLAGVHFLLEPPFSICRVSSSGVGS
jgi:hypothetical protein